MNPASNMLSAKKTKVHGMSISKWTTKDKITQYKGLINLYKRDKAVMHVDISAARKKQRKELESLQKSVANNRMDLMNAIKGGRQALHNALAEHLNFQLAYENTPAKNIIENVNHISFTKRKEYDRLQYEMKLKSQQLIDLKLRKSILEDRIKFFVWDQTKEGQEAEIVSGKVQDVILRKEAALAIRQIYMQIIDIMKKDALYFDAVLAQIRSDGLEQSKCMINATELGQLATEYLDDRKEEFLTLERIVLKDLKARTKDLHHAEHGETATHNNIKLLLRRDSDLNTCEKKIDKSESEIILVNDLQEADGTLKYLQIATLVPSFDDIYPCLQEHRRQNERLTSLTDRSEKIEDAIMEKLSEADLMESMMEQATIETEFVYRIRKSELINLITDERKKQEDLNYLVSRRKELTARIIFHLLQLQQILELTKTSDDKNKTNRAEEIINAQAEEADPSKMLTILTNKINSLISSVGQQSSDIDVDEANKFYENLMKKRSVAPLYEMDTIKESLLEDLLEESSNILTRDDIKRQSDEIVAENTKSDELVPVVTVKKKAKKHVKK